MKKVIIGTLVGTVIYFAFQAAMWMGGFHKDFYSYTPKQDTIMQFLGRNLTADGLYMMPMPDPNSPTFKQDQEKLEKTAIGKPWTMLFYHSSMSPEMVSYMLKGLMHVFIASLLVTLVLYTGNFGSFGGRFLVSMAFAAFALVIAVFSEMNWWGFPWNYVKSAVFDIVFGWGLCSVWLAWFVKKKV